MGLTSLQVCMDSSDHWLQGTISEDNTGMDHSSPPSGEDMLTCSRPLIERRLRPPHEQSLKCPRCESTHTKFCYYNNYSLSQPRYFCKTCRRYWTKGGTLRNIPVGGGCRKNKKQSSNSKKPSNESSPTSSSLILSQQNNTGFSYHNHNNNNIQTDLHLSFPEMHFSALHAANLFTTHGTNTNPNFMLENHTPIEFMDNKYESLVGASSHDFMGNNNGHHENFNGLMGAHNNFPAGNICNSSFGMSSFDHGTSANVLENCQRLMLPYENNHHQSFEQNNNLDVKPNPKILSLEWHDHLQQQQQQACNSDAGKESFGYNSFGGLGSWTGLMNGYGSSAANPLV